MRVKLTVVFSKNEIEALLLKEAQTLSTPAPGHFEVSAAYGYIPDVEARFVADPEMEPAADDGTKPICDRYDFTASDIPDVFAADNHSALERETDIEASLKGPQL